MIILEDSNCKKDVNGERTDQIREGKRVRRTASPEGDENDWGRRIGQRGKPGGSRKKNRMMREDTWCIRTTRGESGKLLTSQGRQNRSSGHEKGIVGGVKREARHSTAGKRRDTQHWQFKSGVTLSEGI